MRSSLHPFSRKEGVAFCVEHLFRNTNQVDVTKNAKGIRKYADMFYYIKDFYQVRNS